MENSHAVPDKYTVQQTRKCASIEEGHQHDDLDPDLAFAPSKSAQTRKFLWQMITSHLGLFLILAAYSFAGAAILYPIERITYRNSQISVSNETQTNDTCNTSLDDLHNFTLSWTKEISNRTYKIDKQNLMEMYEDLVENVITVCTNASSEHADEPTYWTWVLFCSSAYSTVGE